MNPDQAAFETQEALRTRRAEVEAAVDDLIDLLDAIDAATADMEEDDPAEDSDPGGGDLNDEGELSLGAPEKHPHAWTGTSPHYVPADGSRRVDRGGDDGQLRWASGTNNPIRDEGEPEAGYDLGDLDVADMPHDADAEGNSEPFFGAPENHDEHPDQEHWAQGQDGERGEEEPNRATYFDWEVARANKAVAREAGRQAKAMKRRKTGERERDPDEVVFVGNLRDLQGMAWWRGPRCR